MDSSCSLSGGRHEKESIMIVEAVAYAARGFPVMPLHHVKLSPEPRCSCLRKKCHSPGKHPLFYGWRAAATEDKRRIKEWWNVRPSSNIGLTMGGPQRLIALDFDGDSAASQQEIGELPRTWTQTTGRGEHMVYRLPEDLDASLVRNRVRAWDGVDVRSEGGYIVGAPSLHASGTRYKILIDTDPVPLPYWLYEKIVAAGQVAVVQDNQKREMALDRLPHRDIRMRRATCYVAKMPPAIQGQNGSRACLRVAVALVRGFCLTREQAYEILSEDFNPRCTPLWSVVELWHKIDSAMNAITHVPWGYLLERKRKDLEYIDDYIDAMGK
jgi:bifunctional DNA primase/polymerase-like protein